MAENEILDVGDSRLYRKWKASLANPELSALEVANCLSEDLMGRLRSQLRGKPLYDLLNACGGDREKLRQAVTSLKNGALAKLVETAYAITRSHDVHVVASQIADLLIDGLADKANLYVGKKSLAIGVGRQAEIERESTSRLETSRPEIIGLLVASLTGQPIKRTRRARPTPRSVVETSLRAP
jgi:hypothetical protein